MKKRFLVALWVLIACLLVVGLVGCNNKSSKGALILSGASAISFCPLFFPTPLWGSVPKVSSGLLFLPFVAPFDAFFLRFFQMAFMADRHEIGGIKKQIPIAVVRHTMMNLRCQRPADLAERFAIQLVLSDGLPLRTVVHLIPSSVLCIFVRLTKSRFPVSCL